MKAHNIPKFMGWDEAKSVLIGYFVMMNTFIEKKSNKQPNFKYLKIL